MTASNSPAAAIKAWLASRGYNKAAIGTVQYIRRTFGTDEMTTRNALVDYFGRDQMQAIGEACVEAFSKPPDGPAGLRLVNAARVAPKAIDYIWKDRLARGMHTVLAGQGGKGKSQIGYNIIAAITTGGKWPDATGNAPKGRCIILSAEEGKHDMIVPRLIAAGADLSLVEIVECVRTGEGKDRKFNLQDDLEALKAECKRFGDVVLIMIDPVSSYMGGAVDTHRNTAVRVVLDPITQLAEEIGCAILSVTHFNKGSGGGKAINKVMESAAFVNAPRASFGVFDDPDSDTGHQRLLLMLKTNMGEPPPGLSYIVEGASGGFDESKRVKITAPRVVWTGVVDVSADEIVSAETDKKSPLLGKAVDLLNLELANGPKPVADIKAMMAAKDISEMTLKRARAKVGVLTVARKGQVPPLWDYVLPIHNEFDFG